MTSGTEGLSPTARKIVDYIQTLVEIPSPTGFTGRVADFLVKNAESKGIK